MALHLHQPRDRPVWHRQELFAAVQGYHMRYSDEKIDQLVKTWSVEKLVVSKQETKAHAVRVVVMNFWTSLHRHMLRAKPHLLTAPPTRQTSC